jgi:hypothetical protein
MRVDGTDWMDWACWRAGAQDKGGAHVGNRSIAASCICAASSGGYLRSNMGLYRAPVRVRGMAACDAVRPPVRLRRGEKARLRCEARGGLDAGHAASPPGTWSYQHTSTSPLLRGPHCHGMPCYHGLGRGVHLIRIPADAPHAGLAPTLAVAQQPQGSPSVAHGPWASVHPVIVVVTQTPPMRPCPSMLPRPPRGAFAHRPAVQPAPSPTATPPSPPSPRLPHVLTTHRPPLTVCRPPQ